MLTNNIVNNFRYGFIRQSSGDIGNSNEDWIFFRGLNDQAGAVTQSTAFQRPVHNFVDDVSWTRGRHTFQFGTQISIAREPRLSTAASFSDGSANASWTDTSGFPVSKARRSIPRTTVSRVSIRASTTPTIIRFRRCSDVTEVTRNITSKRTAKRFQTARRSNVVSDSTATSSTARLVEGKPSLTLTLGLRYSLFSPPWETNGLQVIPNAK